MTLIHQDCVRQPRFFSRGKEAVCYGPLHPSGQRLSASAFSPDPARVNKLSEFCVECQAAVARSKPFPEFARRIKRRPRS